MQELARNIAAVIDPITLEVIRHGLNSAFLSMLIGAGMTSAITNPLHEEEADSVETDLAPQSVEAVSSE